MRRMFEHTLKRNKLEYRRTNYSEQFYVYNIKMVTTDMLEQLKKCPICGDTCNGKLKVVLSEKGTYCVCHRDKMHKWKIEYNDVMNMIK